MVACIFGTGPGALPTDAYQMGIDPVNQRRMMEESLEAIYALFASEEPVSRETDWFVMNDCRLQVRPYTWPHPEIAVAAMVTPSGPVLAGKHNASLLSLSMQMADGFAAIGNAWNVVTEAAEKVGNTPDRTQLAHPRLDAHRRDARPGDRRLPVSASRNSPVTSVAAPASCRWPRRSTPTRRRASSCRPTPTRPLRDRHAR